MSHILRWKAYCNLKHFLWHCTRFWLNSTFNTINESRKSQWALSAVRACGVISHRFSHSTWDGLMSVQTVLRNRVPTN